MTGWGRLQRCTVIRDGGASVLVGWGNYRPNWLAREYLEATLDQSEVMVGVEDGGGGVATCGRAVWWRGRVSGDGEAVAVPLACARWRGRQGEASGAGELAREGR